MSLTPATKITTRVLSGVFLSALIGLAVSSCASNGPTVTFVDAGGVKLGVEVVDTQAGRERGLMYRDFLPEGRGMWFDFPQDSEQIFWMKNVRFPIDIIFLDSRYRITRIWRSVPPCKGEPCPNYPSSGRIRYALETGAGFCDRNGIVEGQRVIFGK